MHTLMYVIGMMMWVLSRIGLGIFAVTLLIALFFPTYRKFILRSLAGGTIAGIALGAFCVLIAHQSAVFYLPPPYSNTIFIPGFLLGLSFGGLVYFAYLFVKSMRNNHATPSQPLISNKHSNNLYYIIGSFAILFGLFMFFASSDIPPPKNAKKVGNVIHIDIGEEATSDTEKKEVSFVVPDKFKPRVFESEIDFYFKFPDGTPYSGNDFPLPRDQIRVEIKHHAKIGAARSNYILKNIQPKGGELFATPWFVESKGGLDTYQYKISATAIGTYFNFVAKDGSNILANVPTDLSRSYTIDRQFSPHIELTYLIPKNLIRDPKHFIDDVTAVDNAVLKLVQSFQSK